MNPRERVDLRGRRSGTAISPVGAVVGNYPEVWAAPPRTDTILYLTKGLEIMSCYYDLEPQMQQRY
jgi:hypothetical protein